jgi:WD40 repeat protein
MMNRDKKYSILFFALCIFCISEVSAQNDSLFRFLKKINFPVSSFAVDNIGELYLITPGNQLKKYNEKGDSVGVFNQITQYGKLDYVEAQNPWKTILFYKDFATIVLLDKYLNEVTAINLGKLNIFRVQAVTTSYDNNIWLFDEQDNKLKKIDDNGNLISETVDFRLLFNEAPDPERIIDRDGFVYLYDPQKGIYIFDYYGSFKSKLTFLHWTDIEVIGKSIYGFDKENLYKYTPPVPDYTTYPLPPELQNNSSIKFKNHKMYVLKNNQLSVYYLP